ncbi:polysaccharide biosynthesis protein [Pedobacter cryophilus]|uniref:Polysaccharide biosynthesis protein n=1 Tax=Pedobacter cryophilus TaxID=2571271 RepID=A0A4U1BYP6_9SPHI|nr:nucleoside-diphosphate sugar epimerase/dehydratase [Pedobacter cryophilus]TKB97611.1 polysaccharide biosynthesis protein [Pedobacter cryophilus]
MKKLLFCDQAHSRWLVLLIDLFIITWAFSISFLIAHKFQYQEIFQSDFTIFLATYSAVTMLIFVVMRIHTGIIRYSNTEDIFRIFKAVMLSSISFFMISKLLIIPYLNYHLKWLNIISILNFFIAASLLIVLRIMVKSLFAYLKDLESENIENVIIYGSDKKAILIKQAFEFSQEKQYKIIGFVDDYPDRINKNIEQIKVYPSSAIEFLRHKYAVEKMVIMDDHLNEDGKKNAVEKCINLGIKVISVPPSTQWINGRLSLNQMRDLKIEDLLQRDPIILQKDNIFRELSGKRVLITGAAGSIGSEIVRQLLRYNPELVILCDQAETPLHELQLEIEDYFSKAPTKIFMANIQNAKRLKTLFSTYKPQVVFHAAAFKHVPMMENNPAEAILTNVLGTKNLADISLEHKVEKFIMISTDKAVNPTNIMGASKRLAEMYIQSLNFHQARELPLDEIYQISGSKNGHTKFITTRFGNVLGSNGSVVPRFKEQIEKGGPITITHPQITRFFMTIPESVQLVLEASAMGNGGEIFIFDMGKPIKIFDMAVNMIRLAGLTPDKDIKIIYTGLRPGEKLYEELLNKEESVIPTYHSKIKISKVINCHFYYVKKVIDELIELNELDDNIEMVRKMKEIVPEFKSNNSIYNKLDKMVMN